MKEKIKNTGISQHIENITSYDQNELFLSILELKRYDLLVSNDIKINITEDESSIALIEYLLSDEDIMYYLKKEGYTFSELNKKQIGELVFKNYSKKSMKISNFLYGFFSSKEELNDYIKNNRTIFSEYLKNEEKNISYYLYDIDEFITIILQQNKISQIKNIDKYSLKNLKLLSEILETSQELPYYLGSDRELENIFKNIDNLSNKELNNLLRLFTEKICYIRTNSQQKSDNFTNLISANIERIFQCVSETGFVPKCLVENPYFRDECIKRNRIDLAVQCTLPKYILEDESLTEQYCKELNIEKKDLYSRIKWVMEYSKKNNNVFNTLIPYMLKDEIYNNIPTQHLERIINDVDIQKFFYTMQQKDLEILGIIFKKFNYEEYDVSHLLANSIKNIHNYSDLITGLNISQLDENKLKSLISLLQHPTNTYQVTTLEELDEIKELKQKKYLDERKYNDLNRAKENLCQCIFNISLEEAKRINLHYCYNREESMIPSLRNSELPAHIFNMLSIINKIVETDSIEILDMYYSKDSEKSIYDTFIPVDTYLRSQYAKMYSDTLFKVDTPIRETKNGPDKIIQTKKHNNKEVRVCIPRDNFAFLVHCVGTCSNVGDEIDSNYQTDWETRPQMQDHFVACSYLNQEKIYSLRSGNVIAFGFNSIEGGALYGMGNTDIDSIGTYAKQYDGSKNLMNQGNRASFFTPSLMIETTEGYNEVVIERRNPDKNKENFKRHPDYIIMSVDSLENPSNTTLLEEMFETTLTALTEEEKEMIKTSNNKTEIKKIIEKRMTDIREQEENTKKTSEEYVESILNAKYYEQCLKAASEFDIPLIIIDRQYYFNKMLEENLTYDNKTKNDITDLYKESDEYERKRIFDAVHKNKDYEKMKPSKNNSQFSFQW